MPTASHDHSHPDDSLAGLVLRDTGESVARCYQCGKCAAGCPLAADMDRAPSQVLRLLQLRQRGFDDQALRSLSIWLCLTCETCHTRCPQSVDLPRIMDTLRRESLRRWLVHPRARDIVAFHRSFLDTVRRTGRLHEVGLIAAFKARSRRLFQDVGLAPKLFWRGKLSPWPHRIRGRAEVARLFERTHPAKD